MGVTWNTGSAEVYTQVSGTFSFNTPTIQKMYVDWDDGIDNSLENAIYQWKTLESLTDTVTLTHTYTATGNYTPVVRTINSSGFLSKYFYSGAVHSNVPDPKEDIQGLASISIDDGRPFATLKVENKIVLSGIDNNVLRGIPSQVYIVSPPIADGADLASLDTNITFEIEAQAAIYNSFDAPYESVNKTYIISGNLSQFDTNELSTGPANPVCAFWTDGVPSEDIFYERIIKVLSFKLKTPKLIGFSDYNNNEFNKMRFFLTAEYPAGSGDFYPITYVSAGNPIKKLNDSRNSVKLDFSQSRAKASNTSIYSYRYDSGKSFFQPNLRWVSTTNPDLGSPTFTTDSVHTKEYTYTVRPDGLLGSGTIGTSFTKPFASGNSWIYTGEDLIDSRLIRGEFLFNDFNQLTPRYHLSRLLCTTVTPPGGTNESSVLDLFNAVYRITPTISTSSLASTSGSYLDNQVGSYTAVYTDEARKNADIVGDDDGELNQIGLDNWNSMNWEPAAGFDSGEPPPKKSEYLIIADTVKSNRIFFNTSPFVSGMMVSTFDPEDLGDFVSGTKISVSYLRSYNEVPGLANTITYEWVPLEFTDRTVVSKQYRDSSYESAGAGEGTQAYTEKTCSLAKPGFIEFNMPNDWAQVSISDVALGAFNSGSGPVAFDQDRWDYPLHTAFDEITYTGDSPYFTTTVFDVDPGYIFGTGPYTQDVIGKYKWAFQITGGTAGMAGNLLWIASGNATSDKIYCPGNKTSVTSGSAGTADGWIRRINIYEVFDGAWPYDKNDGIPGHLAGDVDNYYCSFMFLSGAAVMATDLAANFKDVYPLKITLQGDHFEASGSYKAGLEMWNIFPANNSHSEIIKEIDNTAYDLNYMEITSDVSVTYAGTYYQAITKGGKVFIQRTGTPIQSINFGGTAMGDEEQFSFSSDYTSYYTLYKLRRAEAESVRVMWDEQQKDGTFVRFFGFVQDVSETHSIGGKRASKGYTFTMPIEEICIIDELGNLVSNIEPLGGIRDARTF
tara:strand:- start:39 stop:3065 length:3027 start_codon:yes stop_codon:yes gene_type:complete